MCLISKVNSKEVKYFGTVFDIYFLETEIRKKTNICHLKLGDRDVWLSFVIGTDGNGVFFVWDV